MANSKLLRKPAKPRPDFPLFAHATGYWAKKIRGKTHYFGKWAQDLKGEAANALWLDQKEDLLAGRTPRIDREGLRMRDLCNRFLTTKERVRDAGDLAAVTFADYLRTCKMLIDAFGNDRFVDDLAVDDFETFWAALTKRYGVH